MTKEIYFYLPRSKSIATNFNDFLKRWQTYADYLVKHSHKGNHIVILTDTTISSNHFENLTVLSLGKARIRQLVVLYRQLASHNTEKMLIAGNNFDALLISLLVRKFTFKTKVQASIHMEIEAIRRLSGFKGSIKRFLLNLMIPKVDSVRVVRASEKERVVDYFGLNPDRILVCPLPVSPELLIDPVEIRAHTRGRKVIGFVGRIHDERRPIEWAEITSRLLDRCSEPKLLIVGEGLMKKQMEEILLKYSNRAEFTGQVRVEALLDVWRQIHTLLVTAPFESYGMAAREALLNGCFVVAPKIDAYIELKFLAPDGVYLYENPINADRVLESVLQRTCETKDIEEIRVKFFEDQDKSLTNLVLSWID